MRSLKIIINKNKTVEEKTKDMIKELRFRNEFLEEIKKQSAVMFGACIINFLICLGMIIFI